MRVPLILLIYIALLSGCSRPGDRSEPEGVDTSALFPLASLIRDDLAEPCSYKEYDYPCERTGAVENEDHSTLWAGISCLSSGEFCRVAEAAVDGEGKVWRSPSQVGKKQGNSTSRDMLVGLLASLTTTGDASVALRLYSYLEKNDWRLCSDADDNRCDMSPALYKSLWGTMEEVWKRLGIPVPAKMRQASIGDQQTLYAQALTSPTGYQLLLVAVQLHIRRTLGISSDLLQRAAEKLAAKDGDNAYFEWLAYGVTQKAVDLTVTRCSTTDIQKRSDWIWSQGTNPIGYDCLAVIYILTHQ